MLVSCVMPTRDRPNYVEKAIRCFLNQTYAERELVILDDGVIPCEELIPDTGPPIRYVLGKRELTIGAKRNAVNALAHGKVLVNWDDDDWSSPGRLADQISFLFSSGCSVVGYHDIFYHQLQPEGFFYYRHSGGVYASGTSQCYFQRYWERNPYEEIAANEDTLFSQRAANAHALASCNSSGHIVARVHGCNTSKPKLGSVDFKHIARERMPLAYLNQNFYERL